MSIRLPRLLDASLHERARLMPIRLSLELRLNPLSTAEMCLTCEDADVSVRDFVELYDEHGSVGIFRISEVETRLGQHRSVFLEHSLCTLEDSVVQSLTYTGTVSGCLERLLDAQGVTRWTLGDCDVPADMTLLFTCGCENILSALVRLLSMLPSGYVFETEQSGSQWLLHLHALSDTDACEGRLTRNLLDVRIDEDAGGVCTRVYPFGAGQGTDRITLQPLLGQAYLQSDAADVWGVVSRTFTAPAIYDAVTLRDVATLYLERHREPTVAITAKALDLSAATGEDADSFRLGRMCRLALPDQGLALHERVVAIVKPDVYGAPGQVTVTLSNHIRDMSDEIAALLREVTAEKLLGGQVNEVVSKNRAEGSYASPIVHYFTIESWAALLDARFAFTPDSGVSVTDLAIDDTYVPDAVWQSGSFSGLKYLKRDALGLPTTGRHSFTLHPAAGAIGTTGAVASTITMKVIQKV